MKRKKKIIFLKVGWMKHYQGMVNDTITKGGSFVEKYGYGHEIFNFLPYKGRVYGYVQASQGSIAIERLGASENDDSINNVLAVWVAPAPTGGVFIIGWYKNATVYKKWRSGNKIPKRQYKEEKYGYYITGREKDSKCLEEGKRGFPVPTKGKGGMGRSFVWYADDPKRARFRQKVLDFINKGGVSRKPKLLKSTKGRSRQPDLDKRQKIEDRAIERTRMYYEGLGYEVNSVEKDRVGWDLETILGNKLLRIEVKGLSQKGVSIELTPNEYSKAYKYKHSYIICVVTNTLKKPKLRIFFYSPEEKKWIDRKGNSLKIKEVVGARMYL